jgi:hypothetical protein
MLRDVADVLDVEFEPFSLTDALIARFDALAILESRLDADQLVLAELILDVADEETLTLGAEGLVEFVEGMIEGGAQIGASYDADGFGRAYVEIPPLRPRITSRTATVAVARRAVRIVRSGRAPRSRRSRATRTSRGAPARKPGGSDDPHPPLAGSPLADRRRR